MNTLLIVCVGNICRSPMAEGLFAAAFPAFRVASAGTGALVGYPADPKAVQLMAARGIDISNHVAQQVSSILCQQSDLILVMDSAQRRYVEDCYPVTRGKVLRVLEHRRLDIPDPYKKGDQEFEYALQLIDEGIDVWVGKINKILEKERQYS